MKVGFPHKAGFGGPGNFQSRFEHQLLKMGHCVTYAENEDWPDIVLVVGGTKKLKWLRSCKRKGIPIVYRLDGINWLHRVPGSNQRTIKGWYKSTIINLLYKYTHAYLADHIIYQSKFVNNWWQLVGWNRFKPFTIIYNGVNLNEFIPPESFHDPRVICLEGNLDYTPYAVDLINELNEKLLYQGIRLEVFGGIKFKSERMKLSSDVHYKGMLNKEHLPAAYKNSIYLSLDINAACPNTVIEAMACGAPVLGYDTGSLFELVGDSSGIIVPYGNDIWEVRKPDIDSLINAIEDIRDNYEFMSRSARTRAKSLFDISAMYEKYIEVFEELLENRD